MRRVPRKASGEEYNGEGVATVKPAPQEESVARRATKQNEERTSKAGDAGARCGLCGKKGKLTRTDCCGQWICDDEDKYVMFSYARNSCHRNHRRYTLCGYHHTCFWQLLLAHFGGLIWPTLGRCGFSEAF
jgi:hypothetical protein